MKNKSQKPERLLGTILLLLSFITTSLFAQPATPIKGESFFTEWCLLLEYRHTVCVQQGTPTGIGLWSGL